MKDGETSNFSGGRTAEPIVKWIEKKMGPACKQVKFLPIIHNKKQYFTHILTYILNKIFAQFFVYCLENTAPYLLISSEATL